jgi:hypothetical protein
MVKLYFFIQNEIMNSFHEADTSWILGQKYSHQYEEVSIDAILKRSAIYH